MVGSPVLERKEDRRMIRSGVSSVSPTSFQYKICRLNLKEIPINFIKASVTVQCCPQWTSEVETKGHSGCGATTSELLS